MTEAELRKLWIDVYVAAISRGAMDTGARDRANAAVELAMKRWNQ